MSSYSVIFLNTPKSNSDITSVLKFEVVKIDLKVKKILVSKVKDGGANKILLTSENAVYVSGLYKYKDYVYASARIEGTVPADPVCDTIVEFNA